MAAKRRRDEVLARFKGPEGEGFRTRAREVLWDWGEGQHGVSLRCAAGGRRRRDCRVGWEPSGGRDRQNYGIGAAGQKLHRFGLFFPSFVIVFSV